MVYDFLPEPLKKFVADHDVYELRLRADKQVYANINGEYRAVNISGKPYTTCKNEINRIIAFCTENSIYAQNENIKRGYITCKNGVRLGVAGECVSDCGKVITIKNFSSVCVRFAREIKGCADKTYELTQKNGDNGVLIISPPGVGKTTMIRDLARQISQKKLKNVLIIDDKNEISANGFDLGDTCDVIKSCDKNFGFYSAIKTLSPDFIVADELINEADAAGAVFAALSGVRIICTIHGESYAKIKQKKYLNPLFESRAFDYYVTLKRFCGGFKICELFNDKGDFLCID